MDKIIECFDKVAPTQIQEQKMLNNIIKQGGNLTMKQTPKRRIAGRLIAAVVAAAVLIVGAGVARELIWSDREMAQQLLQGSEIKVNGVIIEAPTPFIAGAAADDETFMDALSNLGLAVVMVPLNPILDEMGIDVEITEEDFYLFGREVVDGETFVPLTFFRDVLGVLQVYTFEGQIVIENREDYVMM